MRLPIGKRVMLLAPVVQGFVRARVDGNIIGLNEPPKLVLHKKHTIEVVVDRFTVFKNLQQGLVESFETALSLAEDSVCIVEMDDKHNETLFSANFSCPCRG